jgi:hypothetical protein
MLTNSHCSDDISPAMVINGPNTGLAFAEPEATKATPVSPRSAGPIEPAATQHGPAVRALYARAYEWATGERHALMSIDHLLFALAGRNGANALLAAGMTGVGELEIELLNFVHKAPVPALVDGSQPEVDNAVLGVLNHALGYARLNGRDTTNIPDLLDALLDALRKGEFETPGTAAFRRHWPLAAETDDIRQSLARIMEVQTLQPSMLAKALAAELGALRDRTLDATCVPAAPWYRRRTILLLTLGLIGAVSSGVALWSFAT